ncbi:unnamed protein product [Protopolystoma xenopodis]|uniref:Uncharacterized protein n=1 Tax=Protopolystoma xenopodis TaxID=117903 RepID=A0A448XQK9_9PLAT|nr:unnamed protein product [Protopolystoma xenopodis]
MSVEARHGLLQCRTGPLVTVRPVAASGSRSTRRLCDAKQEACDLITSSRRPQPVFRQFQHFYRVLFPSLLNYDNVFECVE